MVAFCSITFAMSKKHIIYKTYYFIRLIKISSTFHNSLAAISLKLTLKCGGQQQKSCASLY